MAGTLKALSKLREESAWDITFSATSTTLQMGNRVLVNPTGLVYEYEGFFEPEFFKLKVIERNERRSLPVRDVARLEKTTRKRPKGRLNSALGLPVPTILGTLVGIPGTVNRNLLRNYVLLLGHKNRFRNLTESWTIATGSEGKRLKGVFQDEVPLGVVTEEGRICFFEQYVASGEPPIAITARAEDLVTCCRKLQKFTRPVLVSDIDLLTNNLQAYDAITECQRTLIIAASSQHEQVRDLRERGCMVWNLSADEILLGVCKDDQCGHFKALLRKADNMRQLTVSSTRCAHDSLEDVPFELNRCKNTIPNVNNIAEVRQLFQSMFAGVLTCAEFVGVGKDSFSKTLSNRIQEASQCLQRSRVWLADEIFKCLERTISRLEISGMEMAGQEITAKGRALIDHLEKLRPASQNVGIITRSLRSEKLCEWLATRGFSIPVHRISDFPSYEDFDELIVVCWPNKAHFDRLLRKYSTRKLTVLAYSFEEAWLSNYRPEQVGNSALGLSEADKAKLLGLPGSFKTEIPPGTIHPTVISKPIKTLPEEFPIHRKSSSVGQQSRDQEAMIEAYYVDFVGEGFAYVTKGHRLPVVNQLIVGSMPQNQQTIPYRTVSELRKDDFVLFRDSGDSDIIRFIVEDEIGTKKYRAMRNVACLWKSALLTLGNDPRTVWNQLRKLGLSKHFLTVKNWLFNDQMIGPKDMSDIELIAKAADDVKLLESLPQVEQAIEKVKAYHIRAGFRLSQLILAELPERIQESRANETELDLGIGKVWILRIDAIDESPSMYVRSAVNRLLWDEN